MDCNVSFNGRLVVVGMTKNNARWKNIAKIFKEETKGIDYESRIFDNDNRLEIFVDRINRKNRTFDYIDEFNSREAILTEQGSKELLAKPDNMIAKILAQHVKFVQKLDNGYKLAEKTIDDAYDKVYKIFVKNGFDTKHVNEMFDNVYALELGNSKVVSEYNDLRKLPGFKDAEMSHVNYLG